MSALTHPPVHEPVHRPVRPPARRRRLRAATARSAVVLTSALVLAVPALAVTASTASAAGPELVRNGSFESGTDGWRTNKTTTTLATTSGGVDGTRSAVLGTRSAGATIVLNDTENTVSSTRGGTAYRASVAVRTDKPGARGQLRVREVGGSTSYHDVGFYLGGTGWTRLSLDFTVQAGAMLDVNVVSWDAPVDRRLFVDAVSLTETSAVAQDQPVADVAGRLNNGCTYTPRGIPGCGAYLGAAIGHNGDPSTREAQLGGTLALHRTYFGPNQVGGAVALARRDLARGRLPWISFKMPYSWRDMAAGRGDAWARDVTSRFDGLKGPVWLAFHHEPENDPAGVQDWVRMQERLGPIVRRADNIGFTVVLMGWHQFYGDPRLSMANMWPSTKVDVAGFDTYNLQGAMSNGSIKTEPMDLRTKYFTKFQSWSRGSGVPWALAETGYTQYAAVRDPSWIRRTFNDLQATGGIGMSYFDTDLNSMADWTLSTTVKQQDFAAALRGSARLPQLG